MTSTSTSTQPTRWAAARAEFHARLAARAAHKALSEELAAFTSADDLTELSAILERHDDAETAEIRSLVDFTVAA